MNKPGVLLFLFLLAGHLAKSTTWLTVANGYWNSGSTWSAGIVPPYASSDTIIIRDTVLFSDHIFLMAGAFMRIDSMGGAMCGHYNITVNAGARLNKYGALNLDTLFMPGGDVLCVIGGDLLMWVGILSNGGTFIIQAIDGQATVYPWDTCFVPIIADTVVTESPVINRFILLPNPTEGNFNLQYSQITESTFYFYNALGQIIFSEPLKGSSGLKNFYEERLRPGIYLWRVVAGGKVYGGGKVVVGR